MNFSIASYSTRPGPSRVDGPESKGNRIISIRR
jgi:hypothetical protein